MKYLLKTTSWNNGCGFASLSTVLVKLLLRENWSVISAQPAYETLLGSFRTVYQQPRLSWDTIQTTLLSFSHPLDQQVIWVAPLRHYLKQTLLMNHSYRDKLFEVFVAALRISVVDKENPSANEYINVFKSNEAYFTKSQSANPQWPKNIRSRFFNKSYRDGSLKAYWDQTGYALYCQHVGEYDTHAPMMTAEELSQLCSVLHIELKITTQEEVDVDILKGYAGNEAVASLGAVWFGNHLQPYTSSAKEAFFSSSMSTYGTALFSSQQKFTDIRQRFILTTKNNLIPYDNGIDKILTQQDLSALYRYLELNKDNGALLKPLLKRIDVDILNNNLFGLLTIFKQVPDHRCDILAKLLLNDKTYLFQLLLFSEFYFANVKKQHFKNWDEQLETCLYTPLDVRGDKVYLKAIREDNLAAFTDAACNVHAIFSEYNYQKIMPLHLACALNQMPILQALLQIATKANKLPRLSRQDKQGRTPMHYASLLPKNTALQLIFSTETVHFKIPINCYDNNQQTLLHYAAMTGNLENVQFLIARGANLAAQDIDGNTPLHLAAGNGHYEVVDDLAKSIVNENTSRARAQANTSLIGRGLNQLYRLNPFQTSQDPISLDQTNKYGETAYMVAVINRQYTLLELLKSHDVNVHSVYTYFLKAIYNKSFKANAKPLTHQALQIKKTKREARAAVLARYHQQLLCQTVDEKGNNLIHECVFAMDYRMANILLYALSEEQRFQLCSAKNKANLTPIDLIEPCRKAAPAAQQLILNKLERLMLKYNAAAFAKLGKIAKLRYHWRWTQDVKTELMSSSWYQKGSALSIYGMPAFEFAKATVASGGNVWVGGEAALRAYFGASPIDVIERSMNFLPERAQKRLAPVQLGFKLAAWWRHTTSRLTIETLQLGTSLIIGNVKLNFGNTYQDNINYQGGMLAFNEALTRQYGVPLLEYYWKSGEDSAKKLLGMPTISEITNWGLNFANAATEEFTGINLKNKFTEFYTWSRENIGGIASPATEFDLKTSEFMKLIAVQDEAFRELTQKLAKILYIAYSYDPAIQKEKLWELVNVANGGTITEQSLQVVVEAIALLPPDNNSEAILTNFLIKTPFFIALNLESDALILIAEALQQGFKALTGNYNDVSYIQKLKAVIDQCKVNAIAGKGDEIGSLVGLSLGVENSAQPILNAGMQAIFKENMHNPALLIDKLNELSRFFLDGEFNAAIDEMLTLLRLQGSPYEDNLARLLVNCYAFQQFNLTQTHIQQIIASISADVKAQLEQKPADAIAIINGIITASFDNAAKSFIESNFMPVALLPNEEDKNVISQAAVMLVLQYRKDPSATNEKLNDLLELINNGNLHVNFGQDFLTILKGFETLGYHSENILTIFLGNSLRFEMLPIPENTKEGLISDLKKDIQDLYVEGADTIAALTTIIENAQTRFINVFVNETLTPIFVTKDPNVINHVSGYIQTYLQHHLSSITVVDKLNYLLAYMNDSVVDSDIVGALFEIANATNDTNASLAQLILSKPIFEKTRLNPAEKEAINVQIVASLEAISSENNENFLTQLSEIIESGEAAALKFYNNKKVDGNRLVDEAIGTGCESIGQRSEFVTTYFMKQNPLYFGQFTGKSWDVTYKTLYDFFNEKQGDRPGHKQHKIDNLKRAIDEETRRIDLMLLVPNFMAGKPLDESTRAYLAAIEAKEVRAAFASNMTQVFLTDSEHYLQLTYAQELRLYRDIVDAQYKYKHDHTKEEQEIHDLIYNAIHSHAIDPKAPQILRREFTMDQAADSIVDNSKLAGENNWRDTPDELTRPIHGKESNVAKRIVNSTVRVLKNIGNDVHNNTGGNAMVGVSYSPGGSSTVGVYNGVDGQVRGINFGFGKTPGRNLFEDTQSQSQPPGEYLSNSHSENAAAMEVTHEQIAATDALMWKIVMEKYPQVQQTPLMEWMDQQWGSLIETTYPKRDESYYIKDFAQIYDQQQRQVVAERVPSKPEASQNEGRNHPLFVRQPDPCADAPVDESTTRLAGVADFLGTDKFERQQEYIETLLSEQATPATGVLSSWEATPVDIIRSSAKAAGKSNLNSYKDLIELLMHPIDTVEGISELAWDLGNLATDKAFDIATEGSRERNQARATYFSNEYLDFKNGTTEYKCNKSSEMAGGAFTIPFLKVATVLKVAITAGKIGTAGKGTGLFAFAAFQKAQKEIQQARLIESSKRISSNEVNKPFMNKKALDEGWLPPYPANLSLREIVLSVETKFYRVHTDPSFPGGRFLARESEIAAFLNNPEALRLHLGLPNVPIYITEVNVPAGRSLYVGRVGPQPTFGLIENSGFQYQLTEKLPKKYFINTRLILPELTTSKRKLLTTTEY